MSQRIDSSFINQVIERTDLVILVDRQVKLRRTGKNYTACCPFHQEKTPSFTVNPDKQFYYCFGCGASGNALSFLMNHQHLGFMDALRQLAQGAGLVLPEQSPEQSSLLEQSQALITALTWVDELYRQQLKNHPTRHNAIKYLQDRGVTGQIAKEFHLGYAPPGWDFLAAAKFPPAFRDSLVAAGLLVERKDREGHYDALRDRIIFPIRNLQGKVIAFGGRVLNKDKPKYLNSPESIIFYKSQELYGLYEARQAGKLEMLLVVEGYLDVIALAQHNLRFAVATLGTATSSQHLLKMFRLVDRICFCFDGDAAGRKAAWKAVLTCIPVLQEGKKISFVFLPDNEDPDSLVRREGPARFAERLEHSESLSDFIFRQQSSGLNLEILEDKVTLVQNIRHLLAEMPAGIYRDLLTQRLESVSGLTGLELPHRSTGISFTANKKNPMTASGLPSGTPPRINSRSTFTPRTGINTLIDHALRFLLHNPQLASRLQLPRLTDPAQPRLVLLAEVIEMLQHYPDLQMPALLALWHQTPNGEILAHLADQQSPGSEPDPEQTLRILNARLQLLELEEQKKILTRTLQEESNVQRQTQLLQQQIELHKQIKAQHLLFSTSSAADPEPDH